MKSSTATDLGGLPRSRPLLAGAAVGVVGVGLLARQLPGMVGDAAGGILYAVLVSLLVALVVPRCSAGTLGVVTFGVCAAIELLQLTGVPAVLGAAFPPVRLALGSTFVITDLVWAAVGAGGAVVVDTAVRRLKRASAARRRSVRPGLLSDQGVNTGLQQTQGRDDG
ncbi:MAG: DUF2809 domain-containing protein [Mycetocola sp.]